MPQETFVELSRPRGLMRGMLHHPSDESNAPAVLLWHGFTGQRVEPHRLLVKTARRLAQEGFWACRFDFWGSGDSDGEFQDVTPESEIEDALAVIQWLKTQRGVDTSRLALIGLSLGGFVSACTAGRASNIKALCLWAATARFGERLPQRLNDEQRAQLEAGGPVDFNGNAVGKGFFDSAARLNVRRELQGFRGRALIVHGTEDSTVPVEEAHFYAEALRANEPQLHLIEGADHTFNRFAWEREVIETTVRWLEENV